MTIHVQSLKAINNSVLFLVVCTSLQLFCPFNSPKRNNIVAVLLYFCSLMKEACTIIDDRHVIILERE